MGMRRFTSLARRLVAPRRTARRRLAILYGGLFLLLGILLLAITGTLAVRSTSRAVSPAPAQSQQSELQARIQQLQLQLASQASQQHATAEHQLLIGSAIGLGVMAVMSVLLGVLVAGRVLRPLREMTDTTRRISADNLHERLAMPGPRDELKDLADTIDGLLARLEAHVAEQQRFAANASHELRTPLAITQTLLEVARNDPSRDDGDLVDRLHEVNTRAIDLTEALLLLSRADRRSFTEDQVDLSLMAEEATETLLPLAESRGVTIETSGETTTTIGSHALLLQLATNLVQNAVVHNLPDHGTVRVKTSAHANSVELAVENTGEKLTPQLVSALVEPFLRGTGRIRTDHRGVGLGLAIVNSITQAHNGTLALAPGAAGGLQVTVQLPAAPPPTLRAR
jgi:two-component system, OmpR family, sensor histidine kinase VanS